MAKVTFKGDAMETCGNLPGIDSQAPDFLITKTDLSDLSLKDLAGEITVLNIFPSVDTGVCAQSVRRFNEEAASLNNIKVICLSRDLPFALDRFCGAEGIKNVIPASELRNLDFGERYGLRLASGPLAGLLARCVIILDGSGVIKYIQLVSEITEEPKYQEVIDFLKSM